MLLSVLQPVLLWDLNPRHWLHAFFQACVDNRGQPPKDLNAFLPWQITDARKLQLVQPVPGPWSSCGRLPQEREELAKTDTS